MKKIVFFMMVVAIVLSLMVGCSSTTTGPSGNQGSEASNFTYFIKLNIEEAGNRDLPDLPIGTEIFIGGRITVLNKVDSSMVSLSDVEPANIVSIGIIDSVENIKTTVRLLKNHEYGVGFLAHLPNGNWQKLNTLPEIWYTDGIDTTRVVLNKVYQPIQNSTGHFPHGFPKAFQWCHGFGIDSDGDVYTYGPFEVTDLQELIITWDGQSNYTSNPEGTQIISIPDSLLILFNEPIDPSMNIKIKISNNYFYESSMSWNPDSLYFEYVTMSLPGTDDDIFYQNLVIYEASNQAVMKLMGVEVDNIEIMNVYRFYTEDLFTFQIINNIVQNVQTLDLRGTLGLIYP